MFNILIISNVTYIFNSLIQNPNNDHALQLWKCLLSFFVFMLSSPFLCLVSLILFFSSCLLKESLCSYDRLSPSLAFIDYILIVLLNIFDIDI